jgi:hypothetical protein
MLKEAPNAMNGKQDPEEYKNYSWSKKLLT